MVAVVPDFGRDPQVLAPDAVRHDGVKRRANQRFVAIDAGAVKVAIADGGGVNHGARNLVARVLV